ncbi:hypothetical protein RXV94_07495 [Yeosuana sp. MJ-SS3]|jgi:hypothetical protein|uniref:Lipoprotein n=1 Tax=Gilvirhabdus luticola TaxID=3079858 RepID=A0ABU3U6G9_9FLAO|nr:hypothetical protein [Yeosuana sp. MJ-SS3]MDU8885999.1 hypothetical protein [Yeosuana sp. MJ-SS3]
MKHFFLFVALMILWSCGNEKVVQLPEIQNANITEVLDVSPAYIFYDITKPDSTDFNRKNLISTTNWLVNVDKRLTLKQVLPHLQYLQEKRHGDGMHKNENARNYFTCNDTSRNTLGFIDFTDIVYSLEKSDSFLKEYSNSIVINFSENEISINDRSLKLEQFNNLKGNLILTFDALLTFQEYIRFKSLLLSIDSPKITIANQEFIY